MTELTPITAAEMRKIEQDAIRAGGVTGLQLMERAGQGVVEAIFETWPEWAVSERGGAARAVVLCGPGNNGGDGFVVARLLAARGWAVDLFFLGDADKLPPDARANYLRWCETGSVHPYTSAALTAYVQETLTDTDGPVPVIDALFGIGQRAPMEACLEPLNAMTDAWFSAPSVRAAPVFVAIDLPTGYDADSGTALAQRPAPADLIVTFHRPKPCHMVPLGPLAESTLVVKDIGL